MKKIVIIGGGASGLVAAIAAARCPDTHVLILEHKNRLGKKILSTGNGRCNLTNAYQDPSCYRSETPELVEKVLGAFGYEDTLRFFDELWLCVKSRNGYVYPMNDQAAAVADTLIMETERLGVEIQTETHVTGIKHVKKSGFHIQTDKGIFSADKVILATGGKAAEVLGSDGSGYTLAKSLGHSIVPVVPALVQLKVKDHPFAKAAGVRVDAKVNAIIEKDKSDYIVCSDTGEIQITASGISGIPVFQISRYIARSLYERKPAFVELDFLPAVSEEKVMSMLIKHAASQKAVDQAGRNDKSDHKMEACEFLMGLFHSKLVPELLKSTGIAPRIWVRKLTEEDLVRLVQGIKHTRLTITDTNGFDSAQVCAGGVRLSEMNCSTMESLCQKNMYLTGELLDVDGICGGYNLQWAWATGYLAGVSAGRD